MRRSNFRLQWGEWWCYYRLKDLDRQWGGGGTHKTQVFNPREGVGQPLDQNSILFVQTFHIISGIC